MKNIGLKICVDADANKTLAALNTLDGLAKWWTNDVSGQVGKGDTIQFRFNGMGPDMKVLASEDNLVRWQCVSGPEEWMNTEISFNIKDEGETAIYFRHEGWQEETPFFHHCSMKWATFLLSLRDFIENGSGRPFPDDIKIGNAGI